MSELFGPDSSKIYSIPAGANFLGELATVLADDSDLKSNPEALADALIYVPNRRSERALAFALYEASGRQALLLPEIRALGDLETSEPPPSAETALADLPPIMSAATRLGKLTRLVMQFYESTDRVLPATSCLAAARELARLLDQAALSGPVDWENLEHLAPVELAQHWQDSVQFLKIITRDWPIELAEAQAMDPFVRRFEAAKAMAATWHVNPPASPVIIAGSTGATPASQILMKAALRLPQGLVVLPGLDLELTNENMSSIRATPSHPQHALAGALQHLSLTPSDVPPWPGRSTTSTQSKRRRFIHEALAPAQNTADWTTRLAQVAANGDASGFAEDALSGLDLIEASDDSEEALITAILMREALEHPSETAALVTPDAGLARRVSAMLKRWNIHVAPSAGQPLSQTEAGSFALLAGRWLLDPADPVCLMAMLQHRSVRFELDAIQALDKAVLRGPRTWSDWNAMVAYAHHLHETPSARPPRFEGPAAQQALSLLQALNDTLNAVEARTLGLSSGEDWFRRLSAVMAAVCAAPLPWSGEDGAALSRLFRDMADLTAALGEQPQSVWLDLLEAEAAAQAVPIGEPHPRLAIWGPLEARLQTTDRLILAGLNEGIWPEQPPADSFLPRAFRAKIGLADPDERIGLAAHDFAQLASAPNVTLLYSRRRDDKPAIASRWIWRLRTLARGALGDAAEASLAPNPAHDPRPWLKEIERAPDLPATFTSEPRPTPPRSARPSQLSVTRIEQLVRDPYAIYCESVLGLQPLDPLNLPADVRVRGTAIHKALERFESAQEQTAQQLLSLVETELLAGGEAEADIIALRAQRLKVCEAYLDWRTEQSHQLKGAALTEERGSVSLSIAGESFKLTGTADRIERRVGNTIAILDFKTGKPPSERQVRAGLSPQMPLQGLIARDGGYAALGAADVEALTYLRFGTQFEVQELGVAAARAKLEAKPVADLIADAERGLIQLLTSFADPNHPFLSAPRPERVSYESAYTRLARRDEWTGLTTYD
ncbi:MAG: double-strand break repair protein AddB [Henriciella sp.]